MYTLGNIGSHRVVCTKLPTVGHTREAMIAAGSTTTRLLGTFQAVEFVILVGVGGGVPHYTDYARHVRLGDIVVSSPNPPNKYFFAFLFLSYRIFIVLHKTILLISSAIYTYCELEPVKEGQTRVEPVYETKSWAPQSLSLQEISMLLKKQVQF